MSPSGGYAPPDLDGVVSHWLTDEEGIEQLLWDDDGVVPENSLRTSNVRVRASPNKVARNVRATKSERRIGWITLEAADVRHRS